jgi:2-iminobutanoate/2-iminopropanoate deaminase
MSAIEIVHTDGAPRANGHYSQAMVHGGTVYVSGQLGRGPQMPDEEAGDITIQTRRALASLAAIVRAAGSDMSRLLKVNLYVADISLWPAVNAEYEKALGTHKPARAIVPTKSLHFGALIEIDAVAAVGSAAATTSGA